MRERLANAALACILVVSLGQGLEVRGQKPVRKWQKSKIVLKVSTSFLNSPNITGDAVSALEKSVRMWTSAADVEIETSLSDALNVTDNGVRGDGLSLLTAASTAENLRAFPKLAESPAAITRVFADLRGNIYEADIALNPFVSFSTDGSYGTYDLQDTLTHEIGHLLGLRHSSIPSSVMYDKGAVHYGAGTYAGPGDVLPESDASMIRSVYGPRETDLTCCSTVAGKILDLPTASGKAETTVWLEEIETGRLAAAVALERGNNFRLQGIRPGIYRLVVRSSDGASRIATSEAILTLATGEETRQNLSLRYSAVRFNAQLIGNSPQISKKAVRIPIARAYRLYLGGPGDHREIRCIYRPGGRDEPIRPSSSIDTSSESVKMMVFDLPMVEELEPGQYTLVIEYLDGVKDYMVGALFVPTLNDVPHQSVRD